MPRRFVVRRSPIHGKGVFALAAVPAGTELMPYAGEVVDWDLAQQRYDEQGVEDGHTFFFDLGDGRVIDGGAGGNSARWINHGCDPNCEAVFPDDPSDPPRITIRTRRPLAPGEELLIDYRLEIDDPDDAYALYKCACGAPTCRGTMALLDASD